MRGLTDGMTNADRVYRAPVNTDGTLGSWTWINDGNLLPSPVLQAPMLVYGGYIYSISGWNSSTNTYTSAVQYAKINSDGSIGTWTTGPNLSITFDGGGYASYGDKIYLISGEHNGSLSKNVYYLTARSGGGGTTSAWTASGNTMATGRRSHGSAIYNGYLYALGGMISVSDRTDSIEYAKINDDGSVGSWNTTTSLPSARAGMGTVAYAGRMYIFGGKTSSVSITDSVYSAPINTNGTLGSWTSQANLPDQISSMAVTMRNGYVYLLGVLNQPLSTLFTTHPLIAVEPSAHGIQPRHFQQHAAMLAP